MLLNFINQKIIFQKHDIYIIMMESQNGCVYYEEDEIQDEVGGEYLYSSEYEEETNHAKGKSTGEWNEKHIA